MNDQPAGKVMALDLGEKRIGVAISDETRLIAKSYAVLQRKSRREDYERYLDIIHKEQIKLVVMGLPVTLGGQESSRAAWVRDYASGLDQLLDIPILFWDESLTTVQAEKSLRERGVRGKKLQQRVDAVAAAFILQSYLDAQ